MEEKPIYKKSEQEIVSKPEQIQVSDITIEWNVKQGTCNFESFPVAMMWVDTTLAGLMSGVQSMVGTKRFGLALQSEGRKSVEKDWQIISQYPNFQDGFKAIANIAAVAGWGDWELLSLDENKKNCQFRVKNSWEGRYQKSLGVCWNSGMLAGKMAGYCSKLFKTNCWAKQTAFIAKGDDFDEFEVAPSERSIEMEIENLLLSDEATRADMAVALQKLQEEIEERKSVEEALRKSEAYLRSIFLAAPTGIGVVINRVIKEANEKLCEMLGYSSDEILGKNARMLYPTDEDFEYVGREKYVQICERGTGTVETRWLRKDGKIIDVLLSSTPIDPDDLSVGVTFTALDITSRKRSEDARRESEEKYRELANSLPQVVYEMDADGIITFANRNAFEFFGYTQDDFDKGLNALHMLVPEDRDRAFENILRRFNGEKVGGQEYTASRKDGGTFPVIVHVSPVIRNNKPIGLRGIMIDITDRKLSEEETTKLEIKLQQAQKLEAIGTLAGGIAHDFNNILSIIIGNTELALDDVPEGNRVHFNLEEINKASKRGKNIVSQLLSFSRKRVLERQLIHIIPIIKDSLNFLRATIPACIDIRQNIQAEEDTVLADSTQIHQIMMNLVANSSHAIEAEGVIEIGIDNVVLNEDTCAHYTDLTPGNYIKMTVCDTGQGIAPEVIDRIFDPYFTTKEIDKGSGIGLSVVHGIVKIHGGAIRVESELGKGTTIAVLFPVVEMIEDLAVKTEEILPTGEERILFIDDEESIVKLGRQRLERLGYKVKATTSSVEALDLFSSKPDQFDLVITDLTMPKLTGDKLVKEILNIRSDIPIILCTGFSEKIDEEKARVIGVADFIEKPFDKHDFAFRVRKALDQK